MKRIGREGRGGKGKGEEEGNEGVKGGQRRKVKGERDGSEGKYED